jgi:hypothetical protein
LSSRRVWVLGLTAAACLGLILGFAAIFGLVPARSEAPPDDGIAEKGPAGKGPPEEIAEIIAEAAERCRAAGGKPDSAAVLRGDDLNGDGRNDWIVDFAKLKCAGASNPACNPDGCLLQLYFWAGDGWAQVFQDFVKSFKFSSSGDTRIMHVVTSGMPCNKPADQTCLYNYRLDKDAVTPVQ